MDTVGDDAWKSVRLAWEVERWLLIGAPVAAVVFLLWVGVTGAAVGFLAELGVGTVTVDPWTAATDVAAVVLFVCWIVAPAAIVTWLVRDRLTTVRGTLKIGYRVRHPSVLLVPPLVVLTVGGLAVVGLRTAATPIVALLVAGSLWFLVRTVAYSYRVFAFSVPLVTYGMVLLTASLLACAALVTGARLAGRGGLVETVAVTLATRTDTPAVQTLLVGTVDLAGVGVPAMAATLVGVPVALGVAYVSVQLVTSVVARLIRPTKRRPELRSGQRYPEFARPTTNVSSSPAPSTAAASTDGEGTPATERPAEADPTTEGDTVTGSDDASDATEPDLSNTRVYMAGDDPPSVGPEAVAPDETCPDCGTTLDPEAVSGTCSDCGADL